MQVIITGGTGFIGGHLARSLSADGHEVIVLTRNPDKHVGDLPQSIRLAKWDARTGSDWDQLITADTVIVNLAGEPIEGVGFIPARWTSERRRRILESRVNAGKAVVSAVENAPAKPQALLQASAVGYYGFHEDEIITEDSPPGSDFLADVCVQWEQSSSLVESMGVRRAVLRTGLPLDPKDGVMPRLVLPFRLFAGGPLGSGNQWYSWIHIADEVGAIRYLMNGAALSGPFNLTSPNPAKNKDLAKTLGRVLQRPSFLPVPGFALRLVFGDVIDLALKGQRVIPERLLKVGYTFKFPELEAALHDLLEN